VSDFTERLDVFFADYFELNPTAATAAGLHAHDDRWPDLTEAGRQARLAFVGRPELRLPAAHAAALTDGERIDRDVLLLELAAQRSEPGGEPVALEVLDPPVALLFGAVERRPPPSM